MYINPFNYIDGVFMLKKLKHFMDSSLKNISERRAAAEEFKSIDNENILDMHSENWLGVLSNMNKHIDQKIKSIKGEIPLFKATDEIIANGGQVFLVGGYLRDELIGIGFSNDLDFEIFGMDQDRLFEILGRHGHAVENGISFNMIKVRFDHDPNVYDFSISLEGDRLRDASKRRDFTLNSLMKDFNTGELHDFNGGVNDIKNKVLRITSKRFSDDPCRVLRGFQLAARFDLEMDEDSLNACSKLIHHYNDLPPSRVWGEWEKFLLNGDHPSKGLKLLKDTGWLVKTPELNNLCLTPQDPLWHPEGDVWVHTCHVVDFMAQLCVDNNITGDDRIVLMLSALLHDIGKPSTTKLIDGKVRALGHEAHGATMVSGFLDSIGAPKRFTSRVEPLVKYHMVNPDRVTNAFVRRMARKLAPSSINELDKLMEADQSGRPPLPPRGNPVGREMLRRAKDMDFDEKPKVGIITGKDLISFGVVPSPIFGVILQACLEAEDEGEFNNRETGLAFLNGYLLGLK